MNWKVAPPPLPVVPPLRKPGQERKRVEESHGVVAAVPVAVTVWAEAEMLNVVGEFSVIEHTGKTVVVVVDDVVLEDVLDDVLEDVVVEAPCAAWLIVAVVRSLGLFEFRTTSVHERAGEQVSRQGS